MHVRDYTGLVRKVISNLKIVTTVCQGSSDPPEKIFNIFASEKKGLHHLLNIAIL